MDRDIEGSDLKTEPHAANEDEAGQYANLKDAWVTDSAWGRFDGRVAGRVGF